MRWWKIIVKPDCFNDLDIGCFNEMGSHHYTDLPIVSRIFGYLNVNCRTYHYLSITHCIKRHIQIHFLDRNNFILNPVYICFWNHINHFLPAYYAWGCLRPILLWGDAKCFRLQMIQMIMYTCMMICTSNQYLRFCVQCVSIFIMMTGKRYKECITLHRGNS